MGTVGRSSGTRAWRRRTDEREKEDATAFLAVEDPTLVLDTRDDVQGVERAIAARSFPEHAVEVRTLKSESAFCSDSRWYVTV